MLKTPHLQLTDHGREPVPDQLAAQVLDRHHPVLGEGGKAWPLTQVVLDLLQQLHRRIRHRHPPGLAVLMGQGEAGAIHSDHGPGRLHHPLQPDQKITRPGQHGLQLTHGPRDKLPVHRHPRSFVVQS
jgi:hypothetical protein